MEAPGQEVQHGVVRNRRRMSRHSVKGVSITMATEAATVVEVVVVDVVASEDEVMLEAEPHLEEAVDTVAIGVPQPNKSPHNTDIERCESRQNFLRLYQKLPLSINSRICEFQNICAGEINWAPIFQ